MSDRRPVLRLPSLSPVATSLFVLLCSCGVAGLAIVVSGTPPRATVISAIRRFVRGVQEFDSWRVMDLALTHAASGSPVTVYDALFFDQKIKFQYPMSSLLFVHGLSPATLAVLSQLSIVATAVLVWSILRRTAMRAGWTLHVRDLPSMAAVGVLTLTFFPVMTADSLGQIQTWINAAFAGLLLAWIAGRERLAGGVLGVMLLIKPTFAPLLLWGLARRKLGFVAAAGLTALAGTIAGAIVFGVDNTLAYAKVARYLSLHGEVFMPNQSWNGLLQRLFETGDSTRFNRYGFPPIHPWVVAGTTAASLILGGLALLWPLRTRGAGGPIDLALMSLTTTMISPIAWDHHYGVLLPIFALIAPAVLAARVWGAGTWPLLIGLYIVASQTFVSQVLHVTRPPWNLVQSYLLMAACGVLWLCYRVLALDASGRRSIADNDAAAIAP